MNILYNILLSIAFAFLFSIFDYFGYNVSVRNGWVNEKFLNKYRITQGTIQILLTVSAWYFFGWTIAIGFFILWWTWCCDLMYYLIYDTVKLYQYREDYNAFDEEVEGNQVRWAWWTPYGLVDLWVNGKDEKTKDFRVVSGSILLFQAFIGWITVIILNFIKI